MQIEISGNFLFHTFFCFTYFVFCVFVSLTAVRISRSVYFFTSNVLLIQVYLRSGNSQRLVAVVFPVYKLSSFAHMNRYEHAHSDKESAIYSHLHNCEPFAHFQNLCNLPDIYVNANTPPSNS